MSFYLLTPSFPSFFYVPVVLYSPYYNFILLGVIPDPAIASNNSSNNPCLTKPECIQQNAMATRSSMSPSFASFPPNNNNNDNNNIGNQAVDHYSIDITRRIPQRAIRVERDYTRGDGITQFSTAYPPQLAGKVTKTIIMIPARSLVNRLNPWSDNDRAISTHYPRH